MRLLSIFFIILISFNIFPESIYILIHGTWACKENWHKLQGEFFKSLEKSVDILKSKLITFEWDGQLNHESRAQAGKKLAKLIAEYPADTQIYIVAHSHGANVGIIASQLLNTKDIKQKINAFFALAGPVNTQNYMPNMNVIEYYYNLYSNADIIQPLLGFYTRIFPKHPRIANIEIFIDDKAPGHCQTHCQSIAYWIPFIHNYFSNYKIGNFENFDYGSPSKIYFYKNKAPVYQLDKNNTFTTNDNYIDIGI